MKLKNIEILESPLVVVLCKSDDVKTYGYGKFLEPLLQDLSTLEIKGIFIAQPGSFIKGTVQTVIVDNLGTHGFAGFVESFFTEYVCRFCTSGEFQTFFQHKT